MDRFKEALKQLKQDLIENAKKKQEEREKFSKSILGDDYIESLTEFTDKYGDFDDVFFKYNYNVSQKDLIMIGNLKYFYEELNKFAVKNDINTTSIFYYYILYNDKIYKIGYDGECYYCSKYLGSNEKLTYIDYNDFKKSYQKNIKTYRKLNTPQ